MYQWETSKEYVYPCDDGGTHASCGPVRLVHQGERKWARSPHLSPHGVGKLIYKTTLSVNQ